MTDRAEMWIHRKETASADRIVADAKFKEIRDYIFPSGEGFIAKDTPGANSRAKVFDNTGELANDNMAGGIHALATNPATKWFGSKFEDEDLNQDEDAALWLADSRKRMFRVYQDPRGGFGLNAQEFYLQLSSYGNSPFFVGDRPGRMPLFRSRALADVYWYEDADGTVDTVLYVFQLSARAAVQQWGNAAGIKVAEKAANGRTAEEKFTFLHIAAPRRNHNPRSPLALQMPVMSLWINIDEKIEILESGYPELPYMTARWRKRPSELYARGAGHKALPDVKMLQRWDRAGIIAAEKTIEPSLAVPDDGVLGPITLEAGGINYVRSELFQRGGASPIRAIETGARPDVAEDSAETRRVRVRNAFMAQLLQLLRDPRMTATQSLQLEEEQLRSMSPVLTQLESEWIGPLVDRTFSVMLRGGLFADLPPALQERAAEGSIRIETSFISPLSKAQKLSEARAISQTMDIMGPAIQADPSILDNQDMDETYRDVAENVGVPIELLRPVAQIEAMRKARQEAAEAREEREAAKDAAVVAKQALPAAQAAGLVPQAEAA